MTATAQDIDANDAIDALLESVLQTTPEDSLEELMPVFETLNNLQWSHILECVPATMRLRLWPIIPKPEQWGVIAELQWETAKNLIHALPKEERRHIQLNAEAQDLVAFADLLPREMTEAILLELDQDTSEELQQALSFSDEQVGRFMQRNILRVRSGISIGSVLERLRKREFVAAVFLVDESKALLGHIPISTLFNSDPSSEVDKVAEPISELDLEDEMLSATHHISLEGEISYLPVTRNHQVVGALAVSTLLNEVRDGLVMANLSETASSEEDLFSPVKVAAKLRAIWLCINLATAFLASWVIGFFEHALQQVVALAILMPVVASMGGIAGSQTLAVTLRGQALNHITDANIRLLLNKETRVALLNGTLIGFLIACIVGWWFDSLGLGLIIWLAVMINSLAAAASGTYIPFVLEKLKIDPAIASAVILTTVTDVVGFAIFLGLGSLLFL